MQTSRPVILGRGDVLKRWVAAVQHVTGGAAITVIITWADELEQSIQGNTHAATTYGETSKGRPLGALPGDLSFVIAQAHLEQCLAKIQQQKEWLLEQREKAEAAEKEKAEAEAKAKAEALEEEARARASNAAMREALRDQQLVNDLDAIKHDANVGIVKENPDGGH